MTQEKLDRGQYLQREMATIKKQIEIVQDIKNHEKNGEEYKEIGINLDMCFNSHFYFVAPKEAIAPILMMAEASLLKELDKATKEFEKL